MECLTCGATKKQAKLFKEEISTRIFCGAPCRDMHDLVGARGFEESTFAKVPREIVEGIMLEMNLQALVRFCQTNRTAKMICDAPGFARAYARKHGDEIRARMQYIFDASDTPTIPLTRFTPYAFEDVNWPLLNPFQPNYGSSFFFVLVRALLSNKNGRTGASFAVSENIVIHFMRSIEQANFTATFLDEADEDPSVLDNAPQDVRDDYFALFAMAEEVIIIALETGAREVLDVYPLVDNRRNPVFEREEWADHIDRFVRAAIRGGHTSPHYFDELFPVGDDRLGLTFMDEVVGGRFSNVDYVPELLGVMVESRNVSLVRHILMRDDFFELSQYEVDPFLQSYPLGGMIDVTMITIVQMIVDRYRLGAIEFRMQNTVDPVFFVEPLPTTEFQWDDTMALIEPTQKRRRRDINKQMKQLTL